MDKNGQVFDANHSFNGWQWEEWQKFEKKLWQLSLEELRELADILEIKFTMGNESINNEEDFINVLDEAVKEDLLGEYEKILKKREERK